MEACLKRYVCLKCSGSMCTPPIEDKINIVIGIYITKKPVHKIDNDEGIFPVVKFVMSLAVMDILHCK